MNGNATSGISRKERNDILQKLSQRDRGVTQQHLDALQDHYFRIYRKRYETLSDDEVGDRINEAFQKFLKTPATNIQEWPNFIPYFDQCMNSVFCDFFRYQPDGNMFGRVKRILKTAAFRRKHQNTDAPENWDMDLWYPADNGDTVKPADFQEVEELQKHSISFAEAGIDYHFDEKEKLNISDDAIAAYIVYLFNLGERLFNAPRALHAGDIKSIVCGHLWIVPVPSASQYGKDLQTQKDMDTTVDPLDNAPAPADIDSALAAELELKLHNALRETETTIYLWLFHQQNCGNSKGPTCSELEEKIKDYTIKQFKRSSISESIHKIPEWMREWLAKWEIDFNFTGGAEVFNWVLSGYFENLKKPVSEK